MRNFSRLTLLACTLTFAAINGHHLSAGNNGYGRNCSDVSFLTSNEGLTQNMVASAKSCAFQKMHLGMFIHYTYAGNLPILKLWEGVRPVNVSSDPIMRNCIQCHAPNAGHEAGTSDDRTPRGVHEGFSCITCHDPHSNNARQSCNKCHPAISHCKIDVKTMNTSFLNRSSPNNIHWLSCTDCHKGGRRK